MTISLNEQGIHAINQLREQAKARGVTLDRYLAELAAKAESPIRPDNKRELSIEEFQRWLTEVSANLPELPKLPSDFSRHDIYLDHD